MEEENVKQETRMISYESNSVLEQTLSKEFDESRLETNGNDMEIVAKKEFNMSLLDEVDFIGLDNTEKTFNVRYDVTYVDDDSTIVYNRFMTEWNEKNQVWDKDVTNTARYSF